MENRQEEQGKQVEERDKAMACKKERRRERKARRQERGGGGWRLIGERRSCGEGGCRRWGGAGGWAIGETVFPMEGIDGYQVLLDRAELDLAQGKVDGPEAEGELLGREDLAVAVC
ncbi:hypothetical protein BC829DRAFT_419389 [Chytridium lagenaria]|nr:hypothetical protein BC829DRAFT_419389 [Chytridium lagenaria]